MQVDQGLISYLEKLSALALTDEEKRMLSGELDEILGYMALLSGLDTEEATESGLAIGGVYGRDDAVTPSLERDKLLQNAPKSAHGMFAAPRTV